MQLRRLRLLVSPSVNWIADEGSGTSASSTGVITGTASSETVQVHPCVNSDYGPSD